MKRSVFILFVCCILVGCRFNRQTKFFDPYGNENDIPFEELCDKVAAEDYSALSEEDIQGWNDATLSDSCEGLDSVSIMNEYEYYRHRADSLENLLKCK